MIRTAIIGYGTWAERHHAKLLAAHPGFELVAVCDRSPERRAAAKAEYGVETFGLVGEELLGWGAFSLAVVTTPPQAHYEACALCLASGRDVVVDKPLAIHREDCDRLLALAAENGQMLAVYHQRRFDGDFQRAQNAVPALGRLALVELRSYGWSDAATVYGQTPWRADDEANGGLLYDMGSHRIDQVLQLSGITPRAVLGRVASHRTAANDHYEVDIIGAPGDPTVRVCGSSCTRIGQGGLYMWGEDGAYLDGQLRTAAGATALPDVPNEPHRLYQNVAAHLNGGEDLIVTPEQAAMVIAICDAARQSSEIGDMVGL